MMFLLVPCVHSTTASSLAISGVPEKVETNIEKRLKELEQSRPLSSLSREELIREVHNALDPFGYFKAVISIQGGTTDNSKSSSTWTLSIQPGPQMPVSSMKVSLMGEGAHNPALLKTLKQLPIKPGDPLSMDLYNKAKQNLINTAENQGYLHAQFKTAQVLIDQQHYHAKITLIFDTGPLFYFGQVRFDPTVINPDLLHRFVPFHVGQAYSTEKILQLNNSLTGSGYFNSVLIKPEINDAKTVPIQVHLHAVPKYSYTLGGGYGTDTGIRGRAGLHVVPVNRQGHKFNAIAQGSLTQNVLQANYIIPGKVPATDQYSITGNYSNLNYNAGYSNSFLISLAQQHNLESFQRTLSVNGLYERFSYSYQPDFNRFLLYPKATFTFNHEKNKLFSPTGYSVTFNGFGASKIILSNINAAQFSMDAKAAYMIEPLRLRLYGHALQGFTATDNINQLPLSLAMLLGGTDNLKGYSFNSIGPGRVLSYGGFELQKEVKKNWYVVGFYDAGTVYNPTPKIPLYDVGAGLMWVSPIGPIKAGLALPVNNKLQHTSGSRLVISMGPDL